MKNFLESNCCLWIVLFLFLILAGGCRESLHTPTGPVAPHAMVVSAHPLASEAGVEILKKGGNAIDAAIAVQFALAVVYPAAGNIGGGGFMVIRLADGSIFSLDYREKAPIAASRDMYLDERGAVIENLSTRGHLAAGVPGTVDGMVGAHKKFGSLSWQKLLEPAIRLAENGFTLTENEADKLNANRELFLWVNTVEPDFLVRKQWERGDTVYMKDLAGTLKRIRDTGRAGFYTGETALLILKEMERGNGIIREEDLEQYESIWREPITGKYKDMRIISMAPPSSGGIALIQLLGLIEKFAIDSMNWRSGNYIHLLSEAEKRVYADRAAWLGDPEYFSVPGKKLVDEQYLEKRMQPFSFDQAVPSDNILEGDPLGHEPDETTHFSIVDPAGNAVSVTTTLNGNFGSKVVVGGAGFFLNNEMDDFSIKPGYPNMFGLIGGEANAIEAGKRMLSSMTPTIVEKKGSLYLVLGSPGGSRIITTVFQCLMNVVDFGMNMQEAVSVPRFHHQWKPDRIFYEAGRIPEETIRDLTRRGHALEKVNSIGSVNAIRVMSHGLEAGADPRGDNAASGF